MKAFNKSLVGVCRHRRAGMFVFLYKHDSSWKVGYENVHKFIDSHVERALEDTASSKLSYSDQDLPPDRYILLHEMAKKIRDPIELRYQILQVFLQARDTTLILVGKHPIPSSEKSPSMDRNASLRSRSRFPAPDVRDSQISCLLQIRPLRDNTPAGPIWTRTSYRTPQHYPPQRRWP